MANSINTNPGALIALQNLNATNKALETTQNRVNTGMKVSSAKDNGAIFAIATNQRADMAAQDAVKNSLQRGQSIVDVALAAGDTITNALEEMKALAVNIQSTSGDAQAAYLKDFNALGKEISDAMTNASFDGVNLWTTAAGTTTAVTTNTSSGTLQLGSAAATNADAGVTAVTSGSVAAAGATVASVQTAIDAVTDTLGTLGTQSKSVGRQLTFVSKFQDALETGIDNLVSADLAKESARLTALQTKQQLGVQALSIANQSSSTLLGLFR